VFVNTYRQVTEYRSSREDIRLEAYHDLLDDALPFARDVRLDELLVLFGVLRRQKK
jgi:hypothetical protein